nr:MAG TPA: hypothetical protein [Caudoviricetes sp.]
MTSSASSPSKSRKAPWNARGLRWETAYPA